MGCLDAIYALLLFVVTFFGFKAKKTVLLLNPRRESILLECFSRL